MGKRKLIIQDWAGNVMFPGKTFDSVESAHSFMCQVIDGRIKAGEITEEDFDDEIGEYYYEEAKE